MFGDKQDERLENEFRRELIKTLRELHHDLEQVNAALNRLGKRSAYLTIQHLKGFNMNKAVFTEFSGPNGTGQVVPPVGTVLFESDNVAIATIDPATGIITDVAAGTCNMSGLDQGNNLSASAPYTVAAVIAQSATLVIQPVVAGATKK
jgi:hypothetical protein